MAELDENENASKELGSSEVKSLDFHIVLTAFAVLLSLLSLIYTAHSSQKSLEATGYDILAATSQFQESLLKENLGLLTMHGIEDAELEEYGVTQLEVVYVLSELRADLMYFKAVGFDPQEVPTKYRKHMLSNEKFRLIYEKILRNRLITPVPYTCQLDLFIKEEIKGEKDKWLCKKGASEVSEI